MQQDILFFGGLNSDDTLELLPQGDYLDLENARNFDGNSDNKLGKVSKIRSTVKVSNSKRLQYVSKTINGDTSLYTANLMFGQTMGTVKDEPNNILYYFVYEVYSFVGLNNRTYYTIYEFDDKTRTITNCVVRTQLAIFDNTKEIRFGNVVSGKLAWVQDTIQPKMIDIEKAINYTKNYYNQTVLNIPAYQQMTMDEFNLIRKPPIMPIEVNYPNEGDTDFITNNIKGKLFQFRSKYVYNDNSESVWGIISGVALPYGETEANGDDADWNLNYINLSFIKPTPEIKEIWLSSRYIDRDGILTEFATFKKLDVTSNSVGEAITYKFYNDIDGTPLSTEETSKIVDLVPLAAGTMEVVSNPDRFVMGRVKDPNYPNITTDVDIEVVTTLIEVAEQDPNTISNVVFESKTELSAYKITTTLDTALGFGTGKKMFMDGRGTCTMIKFNSDWITSGAVNITVKLKIRVNGVDYQYSTGQIYILGDTPIQILTKITDRINTDFHGAGGDENTFVAFRDYNSGAGADVCFGTAINGGMDNTDSSKWVGLLDFNFFGDNPAANTYIVIRTGLLLETYPTVALETADFPKLTFKWFAINAYQLSNNYDLRWTAWRVGYLYLHNGNVYDGEDNIYYTPPSHDYNIVVKNFDGYQTVNASNPVLLAEYTAAQTESYGLYIRPTLAPFGKYGVGIVYYDEYLRPSYVQEITEQYILREDADYNNPIIYKLRLTINHFAPLWARYWSVVLTKNLSQEKIQEVDLSIDLGTPITSDADYIYIDVNTSIDLWYTTFNNTTDVYKPYVFTRGDRVALYNNTTNKYIDKEIVAVDTDGKIMIQKGTLAVGDIAKIVRFYTPQVRYSEPLYYEVGRIYELDMLKLKNINGVYYRFHTTPESLQTSSVPLALTLDFGDIYVNAINHYALKKGVGTVASATYNEFFMPFYPSNLNNFGRAFQANKNVYTDFYNSRIRISNALTQDSFTMGLNRFSSGDLMDVPEKHGRIQGLVELGYTLKVITETKLMSIYVNRTVTVDPNGTEGVLLLNKTLGTLSIPETSFGTIYPNSIVKTNRNLYFFDTYNGCIVRDSANGQFKISDYKYASYVKRLAKVIDDNTDTCKIYSAFNINEYYLVVNYTSGKFVGMPDNKGNVLVFNSDLNRWTHHLRLIDPRFKTPEWGDNISNDFITFINSELFIHDAGTSYNEFYSNLLDSEVQFVFNDDPKSVKLLTAMSIHANKLWHSEDDGDILVPANANYPLGMSSRLKPVKFRNKEGLFYSEFMGNGLTSGMTYDEGIRHGQKLRGNLAKIRLRNSDKEVADLFSVSIKYTPSELSY